MKYHLDWLKEQYLHNKNIDYIFFWGHTPRDNSIDKSCFSQWYPSPFTVEGTSYATAEHWMMAKKAQLFNDQQQLDIVLATDSPASAKKAGRAVKNFNDSVWNAHCLQFVVDGNFHKFSQHEPMKKFLMETGEKVIVEASPFDAIWGIGMQQYETDPAKWKGTNFLGFALMEVRDLLK